MGFTAMSGAGPCITLFIALVLLVGVLNAQDCNCFECKNVTEGVYKGSYYAMGDASSTGGCLYRDPTTGRIIRACDSEATLADTYVYEQCENVTDLCQDLRSVLNPLRLQTLVISTGLGTAPGRYRCLRLATTVSPPARLPATMGQLFMIFGAQLLTFHSGSLLWAIMTYHAVCLTKQGNKEETT